MPSRPDPLADRLADTPTPRVIGIAAGIVLATLLGVVIVVTVAAVTAPVSPVSGRTHQAIVGLPAVLAFYELLRRFVIRAPAGWFLVGRPRLPVIGWVAVGLAFPVAAFGIQLWLVGATLTTGRPTLGTVLSALAASGAAGLLAGVVEELPLRGALLRVLEARWSPTVAVVASAAVFAVLHQGHASTQLGLGLVLSSMFAAGLLLGTIVIRTRSVWPAVGVHAGWNTVFGGQVVAAGPTGAALAPAVFQFRLHANSALLTGGPATLGAAPVTVGLLLVGTVVVRRAPDRWLSLPGGGR